MLSTIIIWLVLLGLPLAFLGIILDLRDQWRKDHPPSSYKGTDVSAPLLIYPGVMFLLFYLGHPWLALGSIFLCRPIARAMD